MKLRPPTFIPAEPVPTPPIRVDENTTARQLTVRTIFAARRLTVPAAVLMIGHQVGEALVPVVMGLAIDRAIATHDGAQLVLWIVVLGAVFTMLSFSFRFGSRIGLLGMQAVQHQLRRRRTCAPASPPASSIPGEWPVRRGSPGCPCRSPHPMCSGWRWHPRSASIRSVRSPR